MTLSPAETCTMNKMDIDHNRDARNTLYRDIRNSRETNNRDVRSVGNINIRRNVSSSREAAIAETLAQQGRQQ